MRKFTLLNRFLAIALLLIAGGLNGYAQDVWQQVGVTDDFSTFPTGAGYANPDAFSGEGYGATGAQDDRCAYKKTPVAGNAVGVTRTLEANISYKISFKLKASGACSVQFICRNDSASFAVSGSIELPKSAAAAEMPVFESNEFTVPAEGDYDLLVSFIQKTVNDSKLRIDDFVLYQLGGPTSNPELTVAQPVIDFGIVDITGEPQAATVNIKGRNLTGPLEIEAAGTGFTTNGVTTISQADAEQETGYDLTVSFQPTAADNYTGKITIGGGGLTEPVEITLNGKGYDPNVPVITIFSENCGTPLNGNVPINTHVWQNADLTYEGVGTVRTSTPSTGYPDASGEGCVLLAVEDAWFQISGINTLPYHDLLLSFGMHIVSPSTEPDVDPFPVEVSTNGETWSPLAIGDYDENTWCYLTPTGKIPSCQNLRIRFRRGILGPQQIRIDDIKLTGSPKEAGFAVISATEFIDFGTHQAGEEVPSDTATVSGTNLKGDLTISYTGDSVFGFGNTTTIARAEAEAGYRLPVTFTPDTAGTYSGTITITGEDAETAYIALKGVATAPPDLSEVFYTENCGTPGGTTKLNVNNWENTEVKYEGTADVRKTLPSSGYPQASGNGCVFINSTATSGNKWFEISQLNTSLYDNIKLSFGLHKSIQNTDNAELLIEVSSDGTTWTLLTIDNIKSSSWNYMTATGTIPSCENLRIRFTDTHPTTQWRLDDFKLTGVKNTVSEPVVTVEPVVAEFGKSEIGETAGKELVITGRLLTGDLNVTYSGDTVFGIGDVTTIARAEAETGYILNVSFHPQAMEAYTGTITISGGGLVTPKTIDVTGEGANLTAATLNELRKLSADKTTVYTLRSNDLIVAYRNGNNTYIQDNTAGILVFDPQQIITTELAEGDLVTEIKGTLTNYNGLLELIPATDVTVGGNRSLDDPDVVTVAQLLAEWDNYESRLVRIDKVEFEAGSFDAGHKALTFTQDGNTMACYDKFNVLAGYTPPTGDVTVVGFPNIFGTTYQIYPRSTADIFSSPTGLENHLQKSASVYAVGQTIYVKAEAGQKITVFNALGQLIAETAASEGTTEITLPGKQLVIVKTTTQTVKVSL